MDFPARLDLARREGARLLLAVPSRGDIHRNLHALWDELLGRQHRMRDVQRRVAELSEFDWAVPASAIEEWIAESHQIAVAVAYDPIILDAVRKISAKETVIQPIPMALQL